MLRPVLLIIAGGCFAAGCTEREPPGLPLLHVEQSLRPIAEPLPKPESGDWLESHPEAGQTFAEYIRLRPRRLRKDGSTIYLLLSGDFSAEQRQVLEITQRYLGVFFQTPVKIRREMPLEMIPDHARRVHPEWGTRQISTAYVLNELLKPDRPDDALAYLCFTSSDLFSSATHNYVLGEAQTWERIGVWSIYRNGNPAESDGSFQQCLRRTMHIATHETGHILALKHCTAYSCNMNGANSASETDRHPLHCCPVCLRKLLWNLDIAPAAYLAELEEFCRDQKLDDESEWYARTLINLEN